MNILKRVLVGYTGNLTRYDHEIDTLIISEFKTEGILTCTRLCNLLKLHTIKKKIRYAKIWEHIARLSDVDILKKSDIPGRNNERSYSLTSSAEYELEHNILDLEGVETRREDPADKEESQERRYKKILTLFLLQAATGSFRWKVTQKVEPGLVVFHNPETDRWEGIEGYNERGVTASDLFEHRDRSNCGLFLHTNFKKSDIEKCYEKLIGNHKDLLNVIRKNEREDGEIEFFIEVDNLRDLITYCSCLIANTMFVIENILKLDILKAASSFSLRSIKQRRKFIQKALEWYISSFGRKKFNRLYAWTKVLQIRCRLTSEDTFRLLYAEASRYAVQNRLRDEEMYNQLYSMIVKEVIPSHPIPKSHRRLRNREEVEKKLNGEIKNIESSLRSWNESILHTYHCRISCDKYDNQMPRAKKYYEFVRSMPQEFSHLRDLLVEIVYPRFLRKEHQHNPELVRYVDTLPTITEND